MSDSGARVLEAVQPEDAKQILRALHDRGGEVARAVEEEVAPYVARMEDHLEQGDLDEADAVLRGVALGLYRFGRESSTTFRDRARDDPSIVLEEALRRWRGRRGGTAARRETEEWLSEHLPEWEWVPSGS